MKNCHFNILFSSTSDSVMNEVQDGSSWNLAFCGPKNVLQRLQNVKCFWKKNPINFRVQTSPRVKTMHNASYEWRVNTVNHYIGKSIIARKPITRCYWKWNNMKPAWPWMLAHLKIIWYPLSYVWYHWNSEPVCNKSHLFFNLFNLFWHTDKNFCFF
jgi:hypothetical protein